MENWQILLIISILFFIGFIITGFFDYSIQFMFGVIAFFLGWVLSKLFRTKNVAKIASNLIVIIILMPLFILAFLAAFNPEKAVELLPDTVVLVLSSTPSIIIGDLAGAFVATFTGE
ncbi:MAG TPA: hypothetical protein PLI99_01060 [archaeon]|nr:hypothetical protein [archaeon]